MKYKFLWIFICSMTIFLSLKASAQTAESQNPTAGLQNPPAKLVPPVWQNTDTQFLKQYPHLQDNLYKEPESHLFLGLSAGVLGFVSNRLIFSANFFQVHYITQRWDSEIFSIAYASTTAHPSGIKSNHFIFRTIPKYRITRIISAGPLLGYEFINFPSVSAVLEQNSQVTRPEPFSTSGVIYGAAVAETFKLESGTTFRVTEVGYQENYSNTSAGQGWNYLYSSTSLRTNPSPLAAGLVLQVEVGILF
jgi:hypothetical protein